MKKFYQGTMELTGAPGSGKTTFIQLQFYRQHVLLGGLPVSYGVTRRIMGSIFLTFYAFLSGSINFRQIRWLIRQAVKYDEAPLSRVNALRNCIAKFGCNFFKSKGGATIIDEGISHIPFILGVGEGDIDEFLTLFRQRLEQVKIVFIENPPIEIVKNRIITRGHKRVRIVTDADPFVERNSIISASYKRALVLSDLNVTFVSYDNFSELFDQKES